MSVHVRTGFICRTHHSILSGTHTTYMACISVRGGVSAQMRAKAEGTAAQVAQLEKQLQELRRQLVESRQQEGE